MSILFALGIILAAGLVGSLLSRRVGLPSITGYIVVGLILGPSVTGLVPHGIIESLDVVTSITLGVVAYLIGGSLRIDSLRGLGKTVALVTFFQSIGAAVLVAAAVALALRFIMPDADFWQFSFPLSLVVGAISAATAPAATMAIIRELKAKGPLTTTLLAVVALDDGVAVVMFSLALGVCVPLVSMSGAMSVHSMVIVPLIEVGGSLALGAAMSLGTLFAERFIRTREGQLALVFASVMLCSGVAQVLGLSLIMANMMLGFVLVNVLRNPDETSVLGDVESILYTLFFVLAGLHFDLSVLATAGALALVVVLARGAGKYSGTVVGATLSQAPSAMKHYLGLALLPEAGVTVGLALLAAVEFPSFGELLLNAVLAATIINELVAPPLSRYALVHAGEARAVHGKPVVKKAEEPSAPSTVAAGELERGISGEFRPPKGPLSLPYRNTQMLETPWTRSQRARTERARSQKPPDRSS